MGKNHTDKVRRSVEDKIAISTLSSSLGVLFAAILIMAVIVISVIWVNSANTVKNLAYTVTTMADGERMEKLAEIVRSEKNLENVDNDPYIRKLYDESANILSQYSNIKAFSFVIADPATDRYIYIMECEPGGDELKAGAIEYISDTFTEKAANELKEEKNISTWHKKVEPYGHLIFACEPIINNGKIVAYLITDIFLNEILKSAINAIALAFVFLVILTLLNLILVRRYFSRNLVQPVIEITNAARAYIYDDKTDEEVLSETRHDSFNLLEIHTGDELEELAAVMKKMEMDLGRYIENLTEATAEKQRISTEFELANNIQRHAMPNLFPVFPEHNDFEVYATMEPAKEIGGDFYDLFMVDEQHLVMVVADVSGKGIPAALFMMISQTIIKNQAGFSRDPAEILEQANEQLCSGNIDSMFVTVWLALINVETGEVKYSLAGHEKPIFKHAGKWELRNTKSGVPLGITKGVKYRNESIILEPGDMIFQYTDGVTEAINSAKEMYREERLMKALNNSESPIPNRLLAEVRADIASYVGETEQFDDITMLGFCYRRIGRGRNPSDLEKYHKQHFETSHIREEMTTDGLIRSFRGCYAADLNNVGEVQDTMYTLVEPLNPSKKTNAIIRIVVDEILGNIDNYAYPEDKKGKVEVEGILQLSTKTLTMIFSDSGIPFDPTGVDEVKVSGSDETKNAGGLGIFIAKSRVDSMVYERKDGRNILTMTKMIEG
ncbi:MAG: SpoIIE family protein phosphatase [Lachnospiraceae bacterium]|nr:SpoIIE family protein phosphatase [Lachnospiraceae bacterium]